MVGAEDVDEPVEAACVLPPDVRGVAGEVRRRAVGAHEDPVLVVAVRARPRPHRALRFERVEERDRLRDLGLELALARPGVEVDAEALEGLLDLLEHRRHGISRRARELG